VRDPKTEQTAVIGSWGTQAAGEFVTNTDNLKKLEVFAPKHWERKNVQVVISTDIIRASSGPPKHEFVENTRLGRRLLTRDRQHLTRVGTLAVDSILGRMPLDPDGAKRTRPRAANPVWAAQFI
jgi:hypothetical protein